MIVPEELKKTYKGELFLIEDSGKDDPHRTLLFSTNQNLKLLSKFNNWLGDGTFKILPLIMFQLFTVFIVLNNFTLPLAYGLLPDKKKRNLRSIFKMLSKRVSCPGKER